MQFMTVMKSHGGSWAVAKMKKNEMSFLKEDKSN
jgi:hypothetical protein